MSNFTLKIINLIFYPLVMKIMAMVIFNCQLFINIQY